jgi:hypothetical protein
MSERRALLRLIDAGLNAQQIARLVELRRTWRRRGLGSSGAVEADLDLSRVLFVRWLVQHGMLSDFPAPE